MIFVWQDITLWDHVYEILVSVIGLIWIWWKKDYSKGWHWDAMPQNLLLCVMSSKAQRLADVLAWSLQERDGMILWNVVWCCLHAFKSHQPSFSYQRSLQYLFFCINILFCHNKIDLYLFCICRWLSINSHMFSQNMKRSFQASHESSLLCQSCQHCRFAFEHQVSSLGFCTSDPCLCRVHGKLGWTLCPIRWEIPWFLLRWN